MGPDDYKSSAMRAIAHIGTFGDTDLFPGLPEMKCYIDCAAEVGACFSELSVGNYKPSNCIETLTPKTWLGFRIAHQLSASDNIIYLASVLVAGESLEGIRASAESMRAVAYRFAPGDSARIFQTGRSFHDWITYLCDFGAPTNPFETEKTVIFTDISDFYQRIYFHRLENVLDECGADGRASGFIRKLIQKVRAKQSFGIPVGTAASRLLAECVLNDTDNFIQGLGLESTRYVDDFRILANSDLEAHSAICQIAEHLMVTEGLSLNVSKTRFQTASELHKSSKKRLQDVFTSHQMMVMEAIIKLSYGEDDEESTVLTKEDAEEDVAAASNLFITADFLFDKMAEISDVKSVDLSIYKAILRALRFMPNVNLNRLLDEQLELLYYIPREFCLIIRYCAENESIPLDSLKERLLSLLQMSPFTDLVYVRSWILDLFARGPVPSEPSDFAAYDFSRSINEKRYELLLKGRFDDKSYFRGKKSKFSEFSDWEKPAVLLGAMCLPFDEYKTWIDSIVDEIPGPFAKIFGNWLKKNHGDLVGLLKDRD
jgi:hypothetical protein